MSWFVHVHMMLRVFVMFYWLIQIVINTRSGCRFSPGSERVSLALRNCSTAHFPFVLGRDIDDETGHSIKSDTSEAFMISDHSNRTFSLRAAFISPLRRLALIALYLTGTLNVTNPITARLGN